MDFWKIDCLIRSTNHANMIGHEERTIKPLERSSRQPAAVDLFCGAGGLSFGMKQAGVDICAGVDIDPACKHPFEANVKAKFYERDFADLSPTFIESLFPVGSIRILAGCAPCQPFSTYAKGRSIGEHQWLLLRKFGDIIALMKPEIITLENVPRLTRHSVFKEFLAVLNGSDYSYSHSIVSCGRFGVPQTRKRLVLLASRIGSINLVCPTHEEGGGVTVREAIQHLGTINAGETLGSDPLHKSSGLSVLNMQRIRHSKPGGTWRDWDESLLAACHARKSGRTFPSVYGRMLWDRPAPTITTQFNGYGNGRFGHPTQDRALSLREGAILQTFPDDYSFVPEGHMVHIAPVARLIGNAVPVKLGEAIGRSIVEHLENVDVSAS